MWLCMASQVNDHRVFVYIAVQLSVPIGVLVCEALPSEGIFGNMM